jgi:hypothetical protein
MAGLEADTSSYKQPLPVSPLDTAAKVGALEQQKQSIDAGKMQNANTALQHMTRAMISLGPDATKEEYAAVAENAVRQGLVPKEQLGVYMERLQKAPDAKSFFNEFATAAATLQEQLNYHLGVPGQSATGQTVTPTVTSVKPGFGQRPVGLPVQQQAPPTTQVVGPSGQPQLLGAQPAQLAPGTAAVPTPLPAQRPSAPSAGAPIVPRSLPVERVSGPTGPTVRRTDLEPTTFENRFPVPTGAATGTAPLFEEGKKAYTQDQLNASTRAQSVKPAIQALKLMPGIATGPGTEQFNTGVAALKAWGLIDTKENDPTVIRQEINKKLAQYVSGSPVAQRSDAAQTLAEAGSPNPKVQLTQALQSLTRDAVALDRVQILKPQAFKGQKFDDYIKHTGNFPQSVDEKALTLDLMDDKERKKLTDKMQSDYKNGDMTAKKRATKFFETLQLARDAKLYEGD